MKPSLFTTSLLAATIVSSLGACSSPQLAGLCPVPPDATPAESLLAKKACYGSINTKTVDPHRQRDVDILFVIDNSPSMASKQKVLASAIPQFISRIEATGADYHVGVVTTDLGYNPTADTGTTPPWNALPACNSYSGDDGVLQNLPCTYRVGLGSEAQAACASLCPDSKYMPANGGRFISRIDGISNVPVFNMGGVDIGPQKAFQCLALVGDSGCGVEQPLEAAKRALDSHRPDNAGFNRGTSVLAVIFITDEDDSSVKLLQRGLLNPLTPAADSSACNLGTATPGVDPQCFNIDYRSIALDLTCDQPMNTPGAKTNCRERADTFLSPIDQYVKFFAALPNPNLVIAGIWTPTLLDNLASDPAKDGQLYVDYVNGTTNSAGLNRAGKTKAGCYNPDPTLTASSQGFAGQAQLRLSTFLRSFNPQNTSENSICDAASYPSALQVISSNIIASFGASCLPKVRVAENGTPECVVGYVDASNPLATPDSALPACSAACCNYFATDPNPEAAEDRTLMPNPHRAAKIAACSADPDCYCAAANPTSCQGRLVAGLWRPLDATPPAGKIVSFQCAVENVAN